MEKLVLVPYLKYQRMLEMTQQPKTSGDSAKITPAPKKKTKRKAVDSDEITVTAPPPGKRDKPPRRRADMESRKSNAFRDWISF